jgi:hypothetical protein
VFPWESKKLIKGSGLIKNFEQPNKILGKFREIYFYHKFPSVCDFRFLFCSNKEAIFKLIRLQKAGCKCCKTFTIFLKALPFSQWRAFSDPSDWKILPGDGNMGRD